MEQAQLHHIAGWERGRLLAEKSDDKRRQDRLYWQWFYHANWFYHALLSLNARWRCCQLCRLEPVGEQLDVIQVLIPVTNRSMMALARSPYSQFSLYFRALFCILTQQ